MFHFIAVCILSLLYNIPWCGYTTIILSYTGRLAITFSWSEGSGTGLEYALVSISNNGITNG